MSTKGSSGVIRTNDPTEKTAIWMENPFSLKIGQVFTGFGVGCGVGVGVGRPLNLGAIPVLGEVMIAARGATDAFSGVHRHVNSSLRKVGAKHIEAGIGCGVGFGHGFGVGMYLRYIMLIKLQLAAQMMEKLGMGFSSTLSHENHAEGESISPLVKTLSNSTFNGDISDGKKIVFSEGIVAPKTSDSNPQHSSRTENVVNNFLRTPLLQEKRGSLHEQAGALQSENNVLQMVLKHQILIEELMQENEKLRRILVEELKVQPIKFESSFTSSSKSSCTDCFECRRKQRKR
ncbi:Unknown protein [Striga hermonthica]|uniref:Uncharacterized protein n=1 Tax=Striga hermonthica TaxID=68872 RepID=A0A9N7RDK7_STRHE|nr:Unknown protein [Striga hermonthica]